MTHRSPPDGAEERFPRAAFTAGVEEGVPTAKRIAGERFVTIASADIIQQALNLGLVDEVCLSLVPVLFGTGIRYFGELVGGHLLLEDPVVVQGSRARIGALWPAGQVTLPSPRFTLKSSLLYPPVELRTGGHLERSSKPSPSKLVAGGAIGVSGIADHDRLIRLILEMADQALNSVAVGCVRRGGDHLVDQFRIRGWPGWAPNWPIRSSGVSEMAAGWRRSGSG